ncbi:YrhC family protein [Tuberibacillus calidus]|jgi:xanthine/uracil permease|uniref:YrhC family protein n=1 Tax=Tuberibacillus calidus TaxID=340097 RepID=UPI0003FC164E|nr:YrhC family protein [Tuberibacillus calidus]
MEKDREMKQLKHKITDYKRFSFIFLFISAFLYIGSALPMDGKTAGRAEGLMIAGLVFLLVAFVFYWRLQVAKKRYEENL